MDILKNKAIVYTIGTEFMTGGNIMLNINLMHPADQLTAIMDRVYKCGLTTTSGGNLSILDDNGDVWITPSGIDKGTLTRNDMICVKKSGEIIGRHTPSVELPFHIAIYQKRPDIKAIIHAHPPAIVAFSLVRRIPDTRLTPSTYSICGKIGMADYAVPGSKELGSNIAEKFQQGCDIVVLENHGAVAGGKDLFSAFMAFEALDFSARMEINAYRLSKPVILSDAQLAGDPDHHSRLMDEYMPQSYTSEEREARRDMCALIHRAYAQKLFTGSQGTWSCRLSDGSILITPHGADRKHIDESDLVRIKGSRKESGKVPSYSYPLHVSIYEKHPYTNTIITAVPPHIMAFAVTDEKFETRTIPESYIQLRRIPKIPFGNGFHKADAIADVFSKSTPIAIMENNCIIVTGSSLLNAFDRLEVAEYSAQAVISAKSLGSLIAINDKQIRDIEVAFNLE